MTVSNVLAAAALVVAVLSFLLNRRAIRAEAEARKRQAHAELTASNKPLESKWGGHQQHDIELANVGLAAAIDISYWVEDESGSRFNAPSSWPRNVLMPQERMTISVNLDFSSRPDWAEGELALVVAWKDQLGEYKKRLTNIPADIGPI
jgi:hypothetical protein